MSLCFSSLAILIPVLSAIAGAQGTVDPMQPPPGAKVILRAHAHGFITYTSGAQGSANVISSQEPLGWQVANLTADLSDADGKRLGRLTFDPLYSAVRGSRWSVLGCDLHLDEVGHVEAPSLSAIPWTAYRPNSNAAIGRPLRTLRFVKQIDTAGGMSPSSKPVRAGERKLVPFDADYEFWGTWTDSESKRFDETWAMVADLCSVDTPLHDAALRQLSSTDVSTILESIFDRKLPSGVTSNKDLNTLLFANRIPELITAISGGNPETRWKACQVLDPAWPGADSALPTLGRVMKSDLPQAAWKIRDFGPAARDLVPLLVSMLGNPNHWWDQSAALIAIGAASVPNLGEALDSPNPILRSNASKVLIQILESGDVDLQRKALPLVLKMAEDRSLEGDAPVRAAFILVKLNTNVIQAIPALLQAAEKGNQYAAEMLGGLGEPAVPALPSLIIILKSSRWEARIAAVAGIGAFGELARPSLPEISALLDSQDADLRLAAALTLIRFGELGKAGPIFVRSLGDSRWERVLVAIRALDSQPSLPMSLLPQLKESLATPGAAFGAACVLSNFGPEGACGALALVEGIKSKDTSMVREAAMAFRRLGPLAREAIPALEELVKVRYGENAYEIRNSMRAIGGKQ